MERKILWSYLCVFLTVMCNSISARPVFSSAVERIPVLTDSIPDLQNGLAQTPPMGWNSWNAFRTNINEDQIKAIADEMASNGMRDAGYRYLVIDDGWLPMHRNSKGQLMANPQRFPHGMKAIADYVHSKGLKFGIYESAGIHTCAGYPGSFRHEKQDAKTFAKWGVDFLKYDVCMKHMYSTQYVGRYIKMARALYAVNRRIVYSIHTPGGNKISVYAKPWQWAGRIANMWRSTRDIRDNWPRMMAILDRQVGLYEYAGPGHWNDPDMLEVGNGGMTTREYKTHFSMWAMLAAPLFAGNDLRHMSTQTKKILTNDAVIAVDQDPAGNQAHKVLDSGDQEIWVKKMADGSRVAALLNRGENEAFMTTSAQKIGISPSARYKIQDLWEHKEHLSENLIRANVAPHGVTMYRVWAK